MDNRSAPVISLGEWIITFIVLAIPLVNIIMLFVWGFSSGTNPSKQNFCRAALILYADVRAVNGIFTAPATCLSASSPSDDRHDSDGDSLTVSGARCVVTTTNVTLACLLHARRNAAAPRLHNASYI